MTRATSLPLLLLALVCSSGQAQVASRAQLQDWLQYLRSVNAPALVELCAPLVENKQAYALAVSNWLQANRDIIARGREVALTGQPNDHKLAGHNAAMISDFKAGFARMAPQQQVEHCASTYQRFMPAAPQ